MSSKTNVTVSQIIKMASDANTASYKIGDAQALIASANANLTMEVASRENILAMMQKANKIATKTKNRVEEYKGACLFAADEFQRADGSSSNHIRGAIGRIGTSVLITGSFLKSRLEYETKKSHTERMMTDYGLFAAALGMSDWVRRKVDEIRTESLKNERKVGSYTTIPEKNIKEWIEGEYKPRQNGDKWNGLCSSYVRKQLDNQGILTENEPGEFDLYAWRLAKTLADKGTTKTGYSAKGYEGPSALDDLLADHPVQVPLTNVVVSMTKGGKIATDPEYGHVVLVRYIQDGKLYFTDSTTVNGIKEGKLISMTVDEFKDTYFEKDLSNLVGVTHLQ